MKIVVKKGRKLLGYLPTPRSKGQLMSNTPQFGLGQIFFNKTKGAWQSSISNPKLFASQEKVASE